MKKCPYCKTLIDDDALFCTECGQKIEETKYCINCGKEIEVDSAFCPYCGVPQQDEERHEDIPKKDENDDIINVNHVDVRQKDMRPSHKPSFNKESLSNSDCDKEKNFVPFKSIENEEIPTKGSKLGEKTKRGKKTNILNIVIPLIGVVCAVYAFFFLVYAFFFLLPTSEDAQTENHIITHENENNANNPINTNNMTLVSLRDCPTETENISVFLSSDEEGKQNVEIYKIGYPLQEIKSENGSTLFDRNVVFFIDANFDDELDIYIGTSSVMSFSSLLLWDNQEEKFVLYDNSFDHHLFNPLFSPSEKAVYEVGKETAFEGYLSKSIWDGGKLKTVEEITEILDMNDYDFEEMGQYSEYNLTHKYTLINSNNRIVAESNDISGLPLNWQIVYSKYHSDL